jgi:glycosyltransferase involved in cell wall biosynthesis
MQNRFIICVSHHKKPKTGGHVRFDRLVRRMAENGWNLLWVSPRREEFCTYETIRFLPADVILSKKYLQLRFSLFIVKSYLNLLQYKNNVSVVITFGETNLLTAFLISCFVRAPLSVGVRSNVVRRNTELNHNRNFIKKKLYFYKFLFNTFIWRFVYKKAEQITVQSNHAKEQFLENFKVDRYKVKIIENDLPPDILKNIKKNYYPSLPKKLLYVGNGSHVKGFDVLLRSLASINNYLPFSLSITIVGISAKDQKKLQNISSTAELKVDCLNWSDDVPSLMRNHDLLIVPSREDQFPNVVLEAFAIGLPVVGSKIDGIRIMLKEDWVMFEPGDSNSLLHCLKRISTKEGYLKCITITQERSKKYIFDWEALYLSYLDAVRN